MAQQTNIEWCDSTFNPWIGCAKVSPACDDCYAARSTPARALGVLWGPKEERHRTSASNWALPKRWEREHEAFFATHGRRRRVFCASLADVFDGAVQTDWRRDLYALIEATPHLDWLLLTKRIGNARAMLNECAFGRWNDAPLSNVWLGATVVNQAEAERDVPKLLAVPAAVHFLSIEPMLGPMYIEDIPDPAGGVCLKPLAGLRWVGDGHGRSEVRSLSGRIDWVICGGESGPKARPMHPDWVRSLRQQCTPGVPFLFKQWGEWAELDGDKPTRVLPQEHPDHDAEAERCAAFMSADGEVIRSLDDAEPGVRYRGLVRPGKNAAGRLLDGVEHNGYPPEVPR